LNLKKGDLITISGMREQEEEQMFFSGIRHMKSGAYQGKPWRVLATSPPFILVTDGKVSDTIDTQFHTVCRVNKEFAREYEKAIRLIAESNLQSPGNLFNAKKKEKKKKKHISECPQCGDKMAQVLKSDKSGWQYVCKSCGHKGPDVPPVGINK
jgi:predicted RNA-binding Zn-ribbon protein involved in translation (DUF1610 family)